MEFGITFKGDMGIDRTIALCRQAEAAGFKYAWFFDSHVLWQECFCTIAACARETRRLRFGTCVTNPATREWTVAASLFATLNRISENRVEAGIGRGDSSVRVLGNRPASVRTMIEFADTLRSLVRGEAIDLHGRQVQLAWSKTELPVWFAAYGPKALAAAGQHGDGLIIQLADPWLVGWFVEQARVAGAAAGRGMASFRVMAAAPAWVGALERARAQTRWFPAMVGNHVADLVERYGRDDKTIPRRLTDYIEKRKGYDYLKHADKDADHLDFISEDIIDSFAVLGPAQAHVERLQELSSKGVTQFNIYLMSGEEERQIAEYGQHVIAKLH